MRNRFLNINAQYVHFLRSVPEMLELSEFKLTKTAWEAGIEKTISMLKQRRLSLTDVTPYLYLYDRITGKRANVISSMSLSMRSKTIRPFN